MPEEERRVAEMGREKGGETENEVRLAIEMKKHVSEGGKSKTRSHDPRLRKPVLPEKDQGKSQGGHRLRNGRGAEVADRLKPQKGRCKENVDPLQALGRKEGHGLRSSAGTRS